MYIYKYIHTTLSTSTIASSETVSFLMAALCSEIYVCIYYICVNIMYTNI